MSPWIEYILMTEGLPGQNFSFFNYYLAAPLMTLRQYQVDSLTHQMLITAFLSIITWKSLGASKQGWVPKPSQASSGFKVRTFK